jgi:hypothetical protein
MSASYSLNASQVKTSGIDLHTHPLGNSERIRLRYGSYGIDVIENNPSLRVSSLYSTHDQINISRTIAVVAFQDINEQAFRMEHLAITNGQSIGIVFTQNGWVIDKRHQFFGTIAPPCHCFSQSPPADGFEKLQSAIHLYSLLVEKAGAQFHYASIAEVHHPDFLQLSDLAAIYGPKFESHRAKTPQTAEFLNIVKSRLLAL